MFLSPGCTERKLVTKSWRRRWSRSRIYLHQLHSWLSTSRTLRYIFIINSSWIRISYSGILSLDSRKCSHGVGLGQHIFTRIFFKNLYTSINWLTVQAETTGILLSPSYSFPAPLSAPTPVLYSLLLLQCIAKMRIYLFIYLFCCTLQKLKTILTSNNTCLGRATWRRTYGWYQTSKGRLWLLWEKWSSMVLACWTWEGAWSLMAVKTRLPSGGRSMMHDFHINCSAFRLRVLSHRNNWPV